MASPFDRDTAAADDGVSVTRVDSRWIVRLDTARTTQEYRCGTEWQARKLAAALRAALRRPRRPRTGA